MKLPKSSAFHQKMGTIGTYTVVVLADHGFPFPNLQQKIEMSNLFHVMEFSQCQGSATAFL